MKIITGLSEQPKQQSTLVLADGTRAVWTLTFVPQQSGWFYDLTWNGTAIASGQRLVSSPNILRQYLNRISFGIAVISPNQLDPTTQTTFVDGSVLCYLLEGADLQTVETSLFNAPPGQVLPEVALPGGAVAPVLPSSWGPAGGDLAYLYPNPQVVAVHEGGGTRLPFAAVGDGQFLKRVGSSIIGAAVAPGTGDVVGPGTATVNNVVLFNNGTGTLIKDGGALGTAAFVNSSSFLAATASASGDLGGNFPSPTVTALHTGATQLIIGSIPDGQFLKRVGSSIVGSIPSGAGDVFGPASSTSGNVVLFDGTTGKIIKDSGVALGTISSQAANSVSISGGSLSGVAITNSTGAFTGVTLQNGGTLATRSTNPTQNYLYNDGTQTFIRQSNVDCFRVTTTGINSTAIGATTPSTGAFTTLSANNGLSLIGVTTCLRTSDNTTNATTKQARWVVPHYLNAEEDLLVLYPFSDATTNTIAYGGGAGANNAATRHDFYTAANNTTTSGSLTVAIIPTGLAVTGTLSATGTLLLRGASAAEINMDSTSVTAVAHTLGSYYNAGASYADLNVSAKDTIILSSGTERGRFSSSGLAVGGVGTFASSVGYLSVTSLVGTSQAYYQLNNTGGAYFLGIDNSTGTALDTSPYEMVHRLPSGRGLSTYITGTGVVTRSSASGLEVIGAAGVSSFTSSTPLGLRVIGATSTNDYSGIDFSTGGQPVRSRIGSYFSSAGSYLVFGTSNNYATGVTNSALTIDYDGVATLSRGLVITGSPASFVAGSLYFNATNGLTLAGKTGSANDLLLTNNAGSTVFRNPTGTVNAVFGGTVSATSFSGAVPVASLNGGTGASSTTFWRGDGVWATPAGGGGGVTSVSGTGTVNGISLSGTVTTTGSLTLSGALSGDISAATSKPAVTGSVLRSFASRAGDVFNVKDYGATGNGSTDDTAAIQAAITEACSAVNSTVFIPPGKYAISDQLVLPSGFSGRVSIIGDARASTILIQTVAGKNGFSFGLSSVQAQVQISELSFHTKPGITCGTAIQVGYYFSISSSENNAGSIVQNVSIWANATDISGGNGGWINGIKLTNCWHAKVQNIYAYGGENYPTLGKAGYGCAIWIESGTNSSISNVDGSLWSYAIYFSKYGSNVASQGTTISNLNFVQVQYGIYAAVDIEAALVTNCQFDSGNGVDGTAAQSCLYLINCYDSVFSNIIGLIAHEAGAIGTCVVLDGAHDNYFTNCLFYTNTYISGDVLTLTGTANGNIFNGCKWQDRPITLGSLAGYNQINNTQGSTINNGGSFNRFNQYLF